MQYDVYERLPFCPTNKKTFGNKRWFARRNALPQNIESQPNTDVTVVRKSFSETERDFFVGLKNAIRLLRIK